MTFHTTYRPQLRPLGSGTVQTFRVGFADGRDFPEDRTVVLDRPAFRAGATIGRAVGRRIA